MAVAFGALRNRNFRFYWIGMLVSMIGTVIQITAQSWLVLEMTNSALMLGLVGASQAIPFLFLALVGGHAADRFEKRKLLYFTQSAMMVLACVLSVLVFTHTVRVWHVMLIAVCMGTANSFDLPTRQAFIYELVGSEDILSAVSLNSILFNLAQIAGPAIAGLVVATIGNAWCFLLNSVSFFAFIVALIMMKITPQPIKKMEGTAFDNIKDGLKYVWGSPILKSTISLTVLAAIFAMPFTILMPIFARDILHVGAKGFGLLMMAIGVGALIGGVALSWASNIKGRGNIFFTSCMVFTAAIILFSVSKMFYLSFILLAVCGVCMVVQSSTGNTILQVNTSNELRGRVMGIYTLAFMGLSPLGSLQAGAVAQFFTAPFAIALGAVIFGLSAFFIFRKNKQLREI